MPDMMGRTRWAGRFCVAAMAAMLPLMAASQAQAENENFSNKLQFPYLRIPGAFSYWQALDVHLAEAAAGQLTPEAALKAAAVDFEEITLRLGRDRQRRAYRASLPF